MNQNTKSKSGFTIIEVVLVLAIAGLIFLIVFLAVPALQRSQRDTQRRSDLSRLMSQVSNYQSNTRGNVPVANDAGIKDGLVPKYLVVSSDAFGDPSGSDYRYEYGTGAVTAYGTGPSHIRYATTARCGADGVITAGTSARQVATAISLEGGGAFCQQN